VQASAGVQHHVEVLGAHQVIRCSRVSVVPAVRDMKLRPLDSGNYMPLTSIIKIRRCSEYTIIGVRTFQYFDGHQARDLLEQILEELRGYNRTSRSSK
jgi:hypothetical protein